MRATISRIKIKVDFLNKNDKKTNKTLIGSQLKRQAKNIKVQQKKFVIQDRSKIREMESGRPDRK